MASVKVAVRVRPFNQRELDMDAKLIIQMKAKKTAIVNTKANARDEGIRKKEFTFDHSYWSHDNQQSAFASQEMVYLDLGTEVVDCAFEGYNACVFAYGQTGSGKTFTMMGSADNPGLIPRICKALFERMWENSKRGTTHRVQVSYLEIYQERVADLLKTEDTNENVCLKVREHPKRGPYVQGLTTCLVTNYNHIQECMNRGNAHRTTASTNMNDVSSRSHAIFTITFVQAGYCDGVPSETVSKIHLVDLAGSERADSTGATGQRLKEGAHINKSLVTLGSVISALAELSADSNGQKKAIFIPYRDSVLTWLLKDSLGGNSKTIMIAAISPADCNYGETLSTLRYANRAKNIINKPTVNEDPNVKLIRELRDEISKLKSLMSNVQRPDTVLNAQILEKEAREKELSEEWAGKWREAHAILRQQTALGLRKAGPGVVLDSDRPHLVAIDDDPLSTGVTLYHLNEGETKIGTEDSQVKQDIVLRGPGMEAEHCTIKFQNGIAFLSPKAGAQVWLNNVLIDSPARLSQGCIIFLGRAHVFRFNDPAEAAEMRRGERSHLARMSLLSWSTPDLSIDNKANEDDQLELEAQRQSLVKEKERFEKEQEAFEKRRKSLEEAQAKLEVEKRVMEEEHAAQARQLQENWRNLTAVQKQRELELQGKEMELIGQREELEKERRRIMGEIEQQFDTFGQCKSKLQSKFTDLLRFILSHDRDFLFTEPVHRRVFQDLVNKSETHSLSDSESDFLVDLLNGVKGKEVLEELVNQHKKELADLQAELERRVTALSDQHSAVEKLDKKLVGLLDQQIDLGIPQGEQDLQNLRESLSSRTEQQLESIKIQKQALTLNLKRINSVQSPGSLDTNYPTSAERTTLSSDTYHTAASGTSSMNMLITDGLEKLMSDSGVELRPTSRPQDDSDMSMNDDYRCVSDSQSTSSSVENRSPVIRKRRKDRNLLHNISQRVSQQKQLIMQSLDSGRPKSYLDAQISVLEDLQKQHMALKVGFPASTLTPATEHPLQDLENSPKTYAPRRPTFSGSMSQLYSPPLPLPSSQLTPFCSLYRSMPSITAEVDNESIVSITGFFLRGTGSQTHYEYEVKMCTVDERWSVLRRFRRFRDLHLSMKAKYGEKVAQIPFPNRQLFSNSESLAQSRKKQLEKYLRRLIEVCKNDPNCCLAYGGPITKSDLINFSPFFRKGIFENDKYGTS